MEEETKETENNNKMKDNATETENNNKIKDNTKIIERKLKFSLDKSMEIKKIFRTSRTYTIIYKKSNYLEQLKDIKLIKDKNDIIIVFIFEKEETVDLYSLINSTVFDYRKQDKLIIWIIFQCLKGIETLHSLNIIHRNINPNNITISENGGIKITEFGNSINDIESKFLLDKIIGELPYIAPECLLGINYNNKIDIWSVGVLMLELYAKKTNIFMPDKDVEKDNYPKKFFNQLKHLSSKFKIPFNFNFNQYQNEKDALKTWLNDIKFDKEHFDQIFKDIPELTSEALDLLRRLLAFNPKERMTAKEALKMEIFKDYQNLNKDEYKKSKEKNNENLSTFLRNLEKEFQKTEQYTPEKRNEIYKKEINNFLKNKKFDNN